jgi:hypothetical protein
VANRTSSPLQCVKNIANNAPFNIDYDLNKNEVINSKINNKNNMKESTTQMHQQQQTIFDCFTSYKYRVGAHAHKSFHLSHGCAYTTHHEACKSFDEFDCVCVKNEHFFDCSMIHLQLSDEKNYEKPFKKYDDKTLKNSKSELSSIASASSTIETEFLFFVNASTDCVIL